VSAAILLAELEYVGIRLRLDGQHVLADLLPDADLHLYLNLIMENKLDLIAELTPRDSEIVASGASCRSRVEALETIEQRCPGLVCPSAPTRQDGLLSAGARVVQPFA
jgi:hypothetical protein